MATPTAKAAFVLREKTLNGTGSATILQAKKPSGGIRIFQNGWESLATLVPNLEASEVHHIPLTRMPGQPMLTFWYMSQRPNIKRLRTKGLLPMNDVLVAFAHAMARVQLLEMHEDILNGKPTTATEQWRSYFDEYLSADAWKRVWCPVLSVPNSTDMKSREGQFRRIWRVASDAEEIKRVRKKLTKTQLHPTCYASTSRKASIQLPMLLRPVSEVIGRGQDTREWAMDALGKRAAIKKALADSPPSHAASILTKYSKHQLEHLVCWYWPRTRPSPRWFRHITRLSIAQALAHLVISVPSQLYLEDIFSIKDLATVELERQNIRDKVAKKDMTKHELFVERWICVEP